MKCVRRVDLNRFNVVTRGKQSVNPEPLLRGQQRPKSISKAMFGAPSHLTIVRNCCVRTSSVRTKLSAPEWASRWEKIRIHRCRCSYCNKDGSRKGFSRKKAILFFWKVRSLKATKLTWLAWRNTLIIILLYYGVFSNSLTTLTFFTKPMNHVLRPRERLVLEFVFDWKASRLTIK